jgi:ferredoxin-type protein NapG
MTASDAPRDPKRRKAFGDLARFAGGAAGVGVMLAGFSQASKALPSHTLRPPGARPEREFLSACVRCGLCVRDCPYHTLKLADWADGPALGSPFYVAREVPCEMCEDIPCVKACPTGALNPALVEITKAAMGVAVIVSRETCLNLQGLRCDVCYRVCPVIDKAITLETSHNARTTKHAIFEPVVHPDACTGCGKCEKSCVLDEAAIKVLPRETAALRQDAHYRRGWVEKQKAGGALVDAPTKLPTRLPEGVEAPGQTAPFKPVSPFAPTQSAPQGMLHAERAAP